MTNFTSHIRNFCIIAHVDHGKSTLADRILEYTNTVSPRDMQNQVLDTMDLERERGITIKAQAVRLSYKARDNNEYILNLIDTPGHVDFSYEVSRSLAACEGVLLVVDASQGVEAQTIANAYLAIEHNLEIIPVINKIDLPGADVEKTMAQIESVLGISASSAIMASAKKGIGIEEILEAVVTLIPPPKGEPDSPLKALIFDSSFDSYQGVVTYIRIFDGTIKPGLKIMIMSNNKVYEASEIGVFSPNMTPIDSLSSGEVGYLFANIKNIKDANIGDTITNVKNPTPIPLPGYKPIKPMVFSGLYPVDSGQYELLRDALEKLHLNDGSFTFQPETSLALGFGFRCGFLGLLHMEIIQERLEREYSLNLLITAPTVNYRIIKTNDKVIEISNPSQLPPSQEILKMEEPYVRATIIIPDEYVGGILGLLQERRGLQKGLEYIGVKKVLVTYEVPLNEVILNFYDKLKTISKGYASLDYEYIDYREADLVRLDVLINGEKVDALSTIVYKGKAYYNGRELVNKMKEIIPRQMYEVAIQAAIGNNIVSRETVKALRKNVTAKCYGGDITRKRKLLEKQKEGKKRMKQIGKIRLPQEAFMAILKIES
ncbi:MAG: translation elongation factor 4 [bacterium]